MPNIQLANPSYFNSGSSLAAGLGAGVDLAGQYQQQQLRRAQAERDAMMAPIQIELYKAQLAQAQQKAAMPDIVWGDSRIVDNSMMNPAPPEPVLDSAGQPVIGFDGQPLMQSTPRQVMEYGDIVRESTGTEYLPGGATRPTTKKETLKLAAERKAEGQNRESLIAQREAGAKAAEERLRIQEQLGAERLRIQEELGRAKIEVDTMKAELAQAKAEAALADPKWRTVSSGEKNGQLVINQVNASGELRAIPTGQKARGNNAFFGTVNMGQIPSGGGNSVDDIMAKYSGGSQSAAATPPSFATVEEAEAAGKAGSLKPGTKIIIAGRSATWQ